jgi:hypothetical protein
LQPVKYDIHLGYIFEDISTYESYRYLNFDMQVDSVKKVDGVFNKHKNKFAMIDIILSEEQRVFSREYVKLQTVAANIGGVAKFFLTASQILMFYYSKQLFISEFANSIVDSKKETTSFQPKIILSKNKINNFINKDNSSMKLQDCSYNNEEKDSKYNINLENNLKNNLNLGLFKKKVAINDSKQVYYCTSSSFKDLESKINQLKEERKNEPNFYEIRVLDLFGFESKKFKSIKKITAKVLSIDYLINNISQLVHLKNFVENTNDLIYFGNGIDYISNQSNLWTLK